MILGKIIGVVIGFRFGMIPGAVIGLVLGHLLDSWMTRGGLRRMKDLNPWARRHALFSESVIVLSAKLSKVDGPVSRAEVDAFKTEFRIPHTQMKTVGLLYDRAKQTPDGYQSYARKLGAAFADAPMVLVSVFETLKRIAASDGPINAAESEFLAQVAIAFGLSGAHAGTASTTVDDSPYAILGVSSSATMEEIKIAWRELVRQHHPDTLMAKGLPKEYVELATRKMAEINDAYDRIRAERGDI